MLPSTVLLHIILCRKHTLKIKRRQTEFIKACCQKKKTLTHTKAMEWRHYATDNVCVLNRSRELRPQPLHVVELCVLFFGDCLKHSPTIPKHAHNRWCWSHDHEFLDRPDAKLTIPFSFVDSLSRQSIDWIQIDLRPYCPFNCGISLFCSVVTLKSWFT